MKKLLTIGFIISALGLLFAACEPIDDEMLDEDPLMEEELNQDF